VIFGCLQACPPSGLLISVCSDAEVGSMHVRMCVICVDKIRSAEEVANPWLMFLERVDVNRACNGSNAPLPHPDLIKQPCGWYLAVGVCVGKPTLVEGHLRSS
jgi:hypothetical protein